MRLQQQQQQLGPSVLLFGCRSASSDYLFKETLADMVQRGALTKVLTAFSREKGVPKMYVQVSRDGFVSPGTAGELHCKLQRFDK